MRKFSILTLSLIVALSCFSFSACKKKEDKDITQLYTTYLNIANSSTKLSTIETDVNPSVLKLDFVYSNELKSKISNPNTAYAYIDNFYNQMLDDAIAPTLLYSTMLTDKNTTRTERVELYNKLEILKTNYLETSKRLSDLENSLNNSTVNQILVKLFSSYNPLIDSAVDLSSNISNIYFNKVVKNANPSFTNNTNLESIALNTKNRLAYYKSMYVDIFLNTQITNYDVPQKIVDNPTTLNLSYTPYTTLKNSYFKSEINSNLEDNREKLIELANNLHLIQIEIDKEYKIYRETLEKIDYSTIDNRSSNTELGYKQLIDQFSYEGGIAYKSFYCINEILKICYT